MKLDNIQLLDMLKEIEAASNIKILHAGIVGSHDTGLDRPDSEIDILFIYADKLEKYFDVQESKQTVQLKYKGLNITAFSLKKAINMIVGSNPAIIHLLSCKNKIISMPSVYRELEYFAREYYWPDRIYTALLGKMERHCEALNIRGDKELKVFLGYVRLALSLHHCSCYGLIKNDFVTLVRSSGLSSDAKQRILTLMKEYKEGKTHTSDAMIRRSFNEIEMLTQSTQFNYGQAPIIETHKIRDFHMKTILMLSEKE